MIVLFKESGQRRPTAKLSTERSYEYEYVHWATTPFVGCAYCGAGRSPALTVLARGIQEFEIRSCCTFAALHMVSLTPVRTRFPGLPRGECAGPISYAPVGGEVQKNGRGEMR